MFRTQVLENEKGQRFVAKLLSGVIRHAQYGASLKANAVYMSMFQLIPYERVQTHFEENYSLAINEAVKSVDGALEIAEVKKWRKRYRQILRIADSECPRQ
jgi:hypothetical protein